MQRLEVSGAVRLIVRRQRVKAGIALCLIKFFTTYMETVLEIHQRVPTYVEKLWCILSRVMTVQYKYCWKSSVILQ